MTSAPNSTDRTGRLRRLWALVRKEALQIVRDPSSILIAFVLPFILVFLFGYGVSLDTTRTRIGLVVEETTPSAQDLAASFRASRYFDVIDGHDRREFEEALVLGRVRGIVVIPSTFAADLAGRRPAAIQVLVDGAEPNTANFVQNYARGVVATWAAVRASESASAPVGVAVEQRFWFNPELASRFFLVPGAIAIVMTLVGTLLTSLVIAREWERGTMEALMATPVSAAELLIGKILPYFVLALGAMTLCVGLAVFLFGVPFRGSLVALYALSAAFLMPALGQGLLISAATKNQFLASQLALMSGFLPAFLLSGFLFEINSMPGPIQWLTMIVPARYLIPSLQTVFLAGDIWSMFLPAIAVMAGMGFVLFVLAARNTAKRIA
ncbi:ABC-2 type transport system permease protein [Chelatococcus caeni]|uniref:ABC-2 type transport system permease protein n=1 Tax=Chelatococcus caeni TaxID=1348468 RepID=A0A840C1N9_9HYPH|nr:ABC transporter permease [Chelatococcus caeni]MBB4018723.1 ABC-2 type transport system permease protein [Chelatococcus caeni]